VLSVARGRETLAASVQDWQKDGLPVTTVAADVSTQQGRSQLLAAAEQSKRIDVLVANVGTNIRKGIEAYTSEEIVHILNTNLISSIEVIREALPLLIAGLNTVRTGIPYGASKAALNQVTRGLAVEWAKHKIRVNLVAPGFVATPLTEGLLANEELMAYIRTRIPMERPAHPSEIAKMIAFLAMPASSYVTGQIFVADGGASSNLI
jgi:Tropinone reductase 1